jgi:hypothetical protein
MAISLFSIVQTFAFFLPNNPTTPSAQLVGTIDQDIIYIEHHRGVSLSLDSDIIFRIESKPEIRKTAGAFTLLSSNGNNKWDIGETISYDPSIDFPSINLADHQVEVAVIDSESNSIVLMATLQ